MLKILTKYWQNYNHIHDHILPNFLINVINILAKTISYKEITNNHILKTVRLIAFKQKLY